MSITRSYGLCGRASKGGKNGCLNAILLFKLIILVRKRGSALEYLGAK